MAPLTIQREEAILYEQQHQRQYHEEQATSSMTALNKDDDPEDVSTSATTRSTMADAVARVGSTSISVDDADGSPWLTPVSSSWHHINKEYPQEQEQELSPTDHIQDDTTISQEHQINQEIESLWKSIRKARQVAYEKAIMRDYHQQTNTKHDDSGCHRHNMIDSGNDLREMNPETDGIAADDDCDDDTILFFNIELHQQLEEILHLEETLVEREWDDKAGKHQSRFFSSGLQRDSFHRCWKDGDDDMAIAYRLRRSLDSTDSLEVYRTRLKRTAHQAQEQIRAESTTATTVALEMELSLRLWWLHRVHESRGRETYM